MRCLVFLLTLFVAANFLHADDYEARVFTSSDGETLPYRLLTPQHYDKEKKYPLVVFLHGAGERGADNAAQLKNGTPLFAKPEVREKYPAFVFVPQCPKEKGWVSEGPFSADSPMKLALDAIDALQDEFAIDPDRLYITGLSMGAYATWDLLSRIPDRIAAAVPICGRGDPARIAVAKGVAVWAFHGMEDKSVPVAGSREMIAALIAAGGAPLYSEYPNVSHRSWENAYGEPELLPWMFAQRRGRVVPWEKVASRYSQPPSSLFPGAGTTQGDLWFRGLWKSRREQWARDREKEQGTVVFFGDSITQGWGALAQDFAGFKVANRGLNGDTSRGLRYRVQEDVIALHPKAVSLLIGTDDLDQGTMPGVVAENVQAIVNDLLKADPKLPIVINKVMPRGAKPGKFPDQIKALNALYETAFAGNAQVTFCDTWTLFDNGDGQCDKTLFPDMLNPNSAGYAKWTGILRPLIETLAK